MAGSGKTTLMQRINSYLHMTHQPVYIINLDPAVTEVPYDPNIDIRDTVSKPHSPICSHADMHASHAPGQHYSPFACMQSAGPRTSA